MARAKRRRPTSARRSTVRAQESVARAAHPEFELRDDVVEQALRTGEHQGLLEDAFGPDGYAELRQLAREVAARGARGGPRVLILPGIMGSKIGRRRAVLGLFDDVFWFDPLDVGAGRLTELALGGGATKLGAVGVMLITYLRLKLRLRAAGYDAQFHPYDWRLGIPELGRELAQRLKEHGGDVDLVAHSMGGLVVRAALAQGASCRRLVMLGTPNLGSFVPVTVFRATSPMVRKVGALDQRHTPEQLARDVFSTFAGLTQMLPAPGSFTGVDLYDLDQWPDDGLRPRADLLRGVQQVQDGLAPGAPSHHVIAGVEQQTVVSVRSGEDGFEYELSPAGDGTVPVDLARLPGAGSMHFVAESHGRLPNNRIVARAVVDLLTRGTTDALPQTHAAMRGTPTTTVVSEEALRTDPYDGRRGGLLSQRELRHVIDDVAAPDARDEAPTMLPLAAGATALPTEAGYRHRFDHVVVGRRRQHRIDLCFASGSITEADTRALALGIFRGVTPRGAASALDRRLQGAVTDISRRRMFSGQVGEIFVLPTGRHLISADLVAFVGLGDFDRFNVEVLQTAAENVIRTFINTRVEEFATVVFGGGSGEDSASALRNLLLGFVRGLKDADRDHHFRRIVICENDAERYVELKEELYRLSSTQLCEDVELTLVDLPPLVQRLAEPDAPATRRRLADDEPAPVYLIVRQEGAGAREALIRSSVLTTGGKATVVTGTRTVKRDQLERLRRRATGEDVRDFRSVGVELGETLLAEEVRTVLARFRSSHLVVVHDGELSRVPWEVVALPGRRGEPWFPAAEMGISHRYAAEHLSIAKWLEERIADQVLNVLLVVNPTEDLDGAEEEGERIVDSLKGQSSIRLHELRHGEATRPALLRAFSSGDYDVVHYAGHAEFNERAPERSGILCHGGAVLAGADLAGLGSLPGLVFFNACEAARVRGRRPSAAAGTRRRLEHLGKGVGLAEAFLRGGVANFLGTYWPVEDMAAKTFSQRFYTALLAGKTLRAAVQEGRTAIRPRSRDWANYILYGNPDFVLKDLRG